MQIGYVRVSTIEQNPARQETLLHTLGVERVYMDVASGRNRERPQLTAMLSFVREGDTVIVESISRFARNTRDLLDLVGQLSAKHVEFVSRKEQIDTTTPTGRFMLTIFAAVAELERESLLDRQREGIALAKQAGKYKGRKPIAVDQGRFAALYVRWKAGSITAAQMRRDLGLSASTFYRRVRQYESLSESQAYSINQR